MCNKDSRKYLVLKNFKKTEEKLNKKNSKEILSKQISYHNMKKVIELSYDQQQREVQEKLKAITTESEILRFTIFEGFEAFYELSQR